MSTKPIHEMTDAEIEALSEDDLVALSSGDGVDPSQRPDPNAEGGNVVDPDADPAANAAADNDEGGEGDQPALTPEQLEAIANGEQAIPKARFDEVLVALREQQEITRQLLAERAQSQQPQQTQQDEEPEPEPFDFKAKRREVLRLMSEGDEEGAAALEEQIEDAREAQRQRDIALAEERAAQRLRSERVQESLETVMADVYERMPFLNSADKTANASAITAVNAEAKRLIAEGKAPAEAIRLAADDLGALFAARLGVKLDAASSESGNATTTTTKKVEAGKDPRTQDAIRRNLGIRQPETTKTGVGNRDAVSSISVKDLTDEQLERALNDGTLDDLLTGNREG